MNKVALLVVAITGILAGCASSPPHGCPLAATGERTCASIEQAYKSANTANDAKLRPVSVFDPVVREASKKASEVPVFNAAPAHMPDATPNGLPVYKQPRVHRVYVPAHVDANGNLRSGEYTYFATEGQWNYGTLKKSGAAADIFEPARHDTAGTSAQSSGASAPSTAGQISAPARPAAPPPAPSSAAVADRVSNATTEAATRNANGAAQRANQVDGITQPYQRLN